MPAAYDAKPRNDRDVLACLRELPALPKPHWSWPFDERLYKQPELLQEVVRVLGAGALPSDLSDMSKLVNWQSQAALLVRAMKAAQVRDVVLNLSPFAGKWGNDERGNDPRLAHDTPHGRRELERTEWELKRAGEILDYEGQREGWPVRVAGVWINCETFHATDDPEWNAALRWINEGVLSAVRKALPQAVAIQHGRGTSNYYAPGEASSGSYGEELYELVDVTGSLRRLQDALALTKKDDVPELNVVLSLGGVIWRGFHDYLGWRPYEFRAINAWTWGSWLNDPYFARKAGLELSRIPRVLLWPRCLPETVATPYGPAEVPAYGPHLVAYVCGAARKRPAWLLEAVRA